MAGPPDLDRALPVVDAEPDQLATAGAGDRRCGDEPHRRGHRAGWLGQDDLRWTLGQRDDLERADDSIERGADAGERMVREVRIELARVIGRLRLPAAVLLGDCVLAKAGLFGLRDDPDLDGALLDRNEQMTDD